MMWNLNNDGFTDGDGTFNIYINPDRTKVTFTYKISLHKYNIKSLIHMKNKLNCGQVVVATPGDIKNSNMCHFRVRDQISIKNIIIPIFEEYHY